MAVRKSIALYTFNDVDGHHRVKNFHGWKFLQRQGEQVCPLAVAGSILVHAVAQRQVTEDVGFRQVAIGGTLRMLLVYVCTGQRQFQGSFPSLKGALQRLQTFCMLWISIVEGPFFPCNFQIGYQ